MGKSLETEKSHLGKPEFTQVKLTMDIQKSRNFALAPPRLRAGDIELVTCVGNMMFKLNFNTISFRTLSCSYISVNNIFGTKSPNFCL